MRKQCGQNIMEFIILLGLVVVVGVLAYTFFGDTVKTMFVKTNEKAAEYKPFEFGEAHLASKPSNPANPSTLLTVNPGDTINVGSTEVVFNTDGSASFNISGQDITLSSDAINSLNEVFQTAGAGGLTPEVMAAMQKLIDDHKGEYAGEVPIEITFGDSMRYDDKVGAKFEGKASVNAISLKVGDDMVVVVNDHGLDTTDETTLNQASSVKGTYIIEGSKVDNKFLVNDIKHNEQSLCLGGLQANSTIINVQTDGSAVINIRGPELFKNTEDPDNSNPYLGESSHWHWDLNFNAP